MLKFFYSKYLFFITIALLLNIVISIIYGKKNTKLRLKSLLICSIFETIGIILGAKLLDVYINNDIYGHYINIGAFAKILTVGYAFLGGIFGAFLSIAIYSIMSNEDFEELSDVFIPNLLLVYSISKLGCYFSGCCIGKTIGGVVIPIQLIEAVVYIVIYLCVILKKRTLYNKMYLICTLFGISRFGVEFLRENTGYMYLSISQVLCIFIFWIGMWFYYLENKYKYNTQRR